MNQNGEKNVFQSVRTKIVGVLIIAMTILSVCLSVVLIRNLRIPLMQLNQNYLYDLAVAYGEKVQEEIELMGYNTAVYYGNLSNALGEVGLDGVPSSYAYLVSGDGTMLYHPTKDKVGQPVENAVVKNVVEQIKTGTLPEPEIVEYEFKGAMKYAAYYVTESGHCILVVSADKDELMSTVHRVTLTGTACTIVLVIIASIIGFFIVNTNLPPGIKI